jgi:hypothetical protein
MTRIHTERLLIVAVLAGLGLSLIHSPGTSDVKQFLNWMRVLDALGPVRGYAAAGTPYPPLASVILFLAAKAGHWLTADPALGDFLWLKVTLFAFTGVSAWIFWRLSKDFALTLALALYFTLEAVALGYLDVFYVSFLLLAVHYLMRGLATPRAAGTPVLAWSNRRSRDLVCFALLLTVACWIKPQPIIGLPFVAVYLLKDIYGRSRSEWPLWKSTRATSAALAEARVIILVMTVISAGLLLVFGLVPVARSLYNAGTHTSLSAFGLNLPWIVQHALHAALPQRFGPLSADGSSSIIYNTPRPILSSFTLLFALHYGALIVWYFRRGKTPQDLLLTFALVFLSYTTLSASVHENHLFTPIALLAMLAISAPRFRGLFYFWCLLGAVNLLLFYGLDGNRLEAFSRVAGVDSALLLSIVAVSGYYWTVWSSLRQPGQLYLQASAPVKHTQL